MLSPSSVVRRSMGRGINRRMPGTSMLNELEREHAIRSAVRPAGRGGGGSLGGGSTASGEHSTWSRIAAAAEDDLEEIEHTLHRADLLNIEEIRLGKLKELKGVSEIQKTMMTTSKGLDSMMTMNKRESWWHWVTYSRLGAQLQGQ